MEQKIRDLQAAVDWFVETQQNGSTPDVLIAEVLEGAAHRLRGLPPKEFHGGLGDK